MTSTSLGSRLQLESFTPDHPAGDGDGQAVLLAMTTEHFTLQTARAVTVSDSNGRTALYLGSLSSSLVALALVAQQLRFGDVFLVFVLTVLPALLFLGLVTYVRVLHNSVEDIIYAGRSTGSGTTTPRSTPPRPTTSCSRAATTSGAPSRTCSCGTPGPSSCSPCPAPWP
jgi:hypothetical protein